MNEQNDFLRRMGEAAALSPQSADRRQVEQAILEHAGAQPHWQHLLAENEALRAELPRVELPEGMEDRLLSELATHGIAGTRPRWHYLLAVAALLLLALGVFVGRGFAVQKGLRSVASLAVDNHIRHLGDHGIREQISDPGELEQAMSGLVAFDVVVPPISSELLLLGGRKCKLGRHEVALTLWKQGEFECSLFQFEANAFGLPDQVARRWLAPESSSVTGPPGGAWIWIEAGQGFVLVGDPGNSRLERLHFP